MAKLMEDFYNHDTVETARRLLGKILVRRLDNIIMAGVITETEAYIGRCDKACHAYLYKKTARNQALFLPPGHAYIYLIYGMYHCLNFVTEPEGEPAAVLIRALKPLLGVAEMRRRRYGTRPVTPARERGLSDGPGKICQAMALTRAENGISLTGDVLFVCDSLPDMGDMGDMGNINIPEENHFCPDEMAADPAARILARPRIGIDYAEEARDFPWRFTLVRNP